MDKIIDALRVFYEALVKAYGASGTLVISAVVVVLAIGWRIYNDRKKGKEIHEALAEKDRTIQRLAEDNREWRVLFFREKAGWTDAEIEKYVMRGQFSDGPSARKHLEGAQPNKPKDDPSKGGKGKAKP